MLMTALLPLSLPSRSSIRTLNRRWPVGAEIVAPGTTHLRVWAPARQQVEVILEGGSRQGIPLVAEEAGYFSGTIQVGVGTRYRFRLDGGDMLFPDPVSRFQ